MSQDASFQHTFSVSAGTYDDDGYGGEVTYNTTINDKFFTQIALNGTYSNFQSGDTSVPYYNFTGSYSLFFTVFTLRHRRKFQQKFSIGGGAVVGYESVNNGERDITPILVVELDEDELSGVIYGGVATLDLDIIFNNNISIVIKTSQFYHLNTKVGALTNYSGIGIRYFFN